MKPFLLLLVLLPLAGICQTDPEQIVVLRELEAKERKQTQTLAVTFPIDSITHRIDFTDVVKVDSANAKELFSRARLFVANLFKSAKDVTQLEDAVANTIVCKGNFDVITSNLGKRNEGYVVFKFTVQCRDGRYKYSITDFEHKNNLSQTYAGGPLENDKAAAGGFFFPRKSWDQIKLASYSEIQHIIGSLKTTMANSGVKNDW